LQLENTLGGVEALQLRVSSLLAPCLSQFAVAVADDALWKQLNYQVLLKARHNLPQVSAMGNVTLSLHQEPFDIIFLYMCYVSSLTATSLQFTTTFECYIFAFNFTCVHVCQEQVAGILYFHKQCVCVYVHAGGGRWFVVVVAFVIARRSEAGNNKIRKAVLRCVTYRITNSIL
jgi:hypothetical protein